MAMLCQLADPTDYQVSQWNLALDPEDCSYWLKLFGEFPSYIKPRLTEDGLAGDDFLRRWQAFTREYAAGIDALREQARQQAQLTTLELCRFRQRLLDQYHWPDPYQQVKRRENESAIAMYPQVVAQIDAVSSIERWNLLFRGLFAGNIFDLGCPETIGMFNAGRLDFFEVFKQLPQRPWFVDDADVLRERLLSPSRYQQTLIFVDNAGSDGVLGMMPLARELAGLGTRVVLAANTSAALNDLTIDELNWLLGRLVEQDPVLKSHVDSGQIRTVATGNNVPLIDLSAISEECNAVAAQSDLIVIEGMGRAVESNWHVPMKCDCWRVALLKDHSVVRWLGAKLFDGVCRFDEAVRRRRRSR